MNAAPLAVLAIFAVAPGTGLRTGVPLPRLWPPNPQRLPARILRIPPPTPAYRWN